jgi:hypothetical protein
MTEQITDAAPDHAAGTLTTTKTMTISEAMKWLPDSLADEWVAEQRDELWTDYDVVEAIADIDDYVLTRLFWWAIRAALDKLAPVHIVPNPEKPEED